jgi:hypothetical protein
MRQSDTNRVRQRHKKAVIQGKKESRVRQTRRKPLDREIRKQS